MTDGKIVQDTTIGRLKSKPSGWRRVEWPGGAFETAFRERTEVVEGSIRSDNHLLMVTLRGGADRHEAVADDGSRYDGPDRPGYVSFLPAGCERRLRLHDVSWRWAAIALPADLTPDARPSLASIRPFVGVEDRFLVGMLAEFERLDAAEGGLDPVYCQTMTSALSAYILRRFGSLAERQVLRSMALPAWRLKRVSDYIDAHLAEEIRIATLAGLCGLSERHFHRAFRDTTGRTPLDFIQGRRIDMAKGLLAKRGLSTTEVAFRIGFQSPTHFARIFRVIAGTSPSAYRRAFHTE